MLFNPLGELAADEAAQNEAEKASAHACKMGGEGGSGGEDGTGGEAAVGHAGQGRSGMEVARLAVQGGGIAACGSWRVASWCI